MNKMKEREREREMSRHYIAEYLQENILYFKLFIRF